MRRLLFISIFLITATAFAESKDNTLQLAVSPATAPVPALKYQLLPEVKDQYPGNPAHAYLKCFMEQDNFFVGKESRELNEKLLKCPLSEIEKGKYKNYGGNIISNIRYAAHLETVDWGILTLLKRDGYGTLLPDIQKVRQLINALAVRTRIEIVEGNYEAALDCLKSMFAISRHMGEHPTIIGALVGLAIHNAASVRVEELIQSPGAPNLYWALTYYPQPSLDLSRGLSSELGGLEFHFGDLLNPQFTWNEDRIRLAQSKVNEMSYIVLQSMSKERRPDVDRFLRERIADAVWIERTRKQLIEWAYPADKTAQYPPEQVLLYYLVRKSQIELQETIKYSQLPFVEFAKLPATKAKEPNMEEMITQSLTPALHKLKLSLAQRDQKIAFLRGIEMIRMHAANHGSFPQNLADTKLPIPIDPFNGKPIAYQVAGNKAIFTTANLSEGIFKDLVLPTHYEVTLRK